MRTLTLLAVAILLVGAGHPYLLHRDEEGVVRLRQGNLEVPVARGGLKDGFHLLKHGDHHWLFLVHETWIAVGRSKRVEGPYLDHRGRSMLDGGGTLAGGGRKTPPGEWVILWPEGGFPIVADPGTEKSWTGACAKPWPLAGPFDHWVDGRPSSRLVLASDGSIVADRRPNRWRRKGESLVMTWPNSAAPGGTWVDRCIISKDGRRYMGRNQWQAMISGVAVDAEATLRPNSRLFPMAMLPGRVLATPGDLTLFADETDVRGEQIVLYLVNRTREPIRFDAQDGDIYIMLEGKAKDGKWERAQRHARSGWEGSFRVKPELPAGHFHMLLGRYPKGGETRRVRYRIHTESGAVSNEIDGRVLPGEILWSRVDDLSKDGADFDRVTEIALAEIPLPVRDPIDIRSRAIGRLFDFRKDERTEKILRSLTLDPHPLIVTRARQTLHRIQNARSTSD
jgi:hypothetical protein